MELFPLALYVLFSYQTYALECKPPSCVIEVIESGEYTFGIQPDEAVNITTCFYQTNTGISGSFLINPPKGKFVQKVVKKNLISDYGKVGLCQMKVENVDDTGPTFWTIRPTNEEKQQNFKELNFTVRFFYKTKLLSDTVSIRKGGSFYQYINVDTKFSFCQVRFGDKEVDLKINITAKSIEARITSMGKGLCGFVFTNASSSDPSEWSLIANDGEKTYKANFNIKLYEAAAVRFKKAVVLGDSVLIQCGDEYNQDYCYLYNPEGKFVTTNRNCRYAIKTVAIHHLGTWNCKIGKFPAMETLNYSVELLAAEGTSVRTWLTEDDKYINIGCQIINFPEIDQCRMLLPNGNALSLRIGSVYDRYTSVGTHFKNGTCSLMIKKPLTADDEGQWRCEIYYGTSRTGGFINLGNVEPLRYKKNKTITTQLAESLVVQCEVPYSSEYCYIRSPNGSECAVKNNMESRLGICSLSIESVKPEHVGYWHCYFARGAGMPDDQITVKIEAPEFLLRTTKVQERSGGNASIMCSSYGLPLQYCRFVAPNNLSYFIENHQISSRISYKGRGLEYGECGITITNVAVSDSGIWTCITRVGYNFNQQEVSATINLYIEPTFFQNPITVIGFATATLVMSLSGIVFFGVKYWKKRSQGVDNDIYAESSRENMVNIRFPTYGNLPDDLAENHAHQT